MSESQWSEWKTHDDSHCPVEEGTITQVRFADGNVSDVDDAWWSTGPRRVTAWRYSCDDKDNNIVEYRTLTHS